MERAYQRVRELAVRGTHIKSGHRLADLSLAEICEHGHAELSELYYAMRDGTPEPVEALYELADVLAIVLHLAHKLGRDLDEIEEAILFKLSIRFREDLVLDELKPPSINDREWEEGDPCPRGCGGALVNPPVENCSCHISPPCSEHTRNRLRCTICGWEFEGEHA